VRVSLFEASPKLRSVFIERLFADQKLSHIALNHFLLSRAGCENVARTPVSYYLKTVSKLEMRLRALKRKGGSPKGLSASPPAGPKHAKAAPFRRNDEMLSVMPTGVIIFPGSGITGNRADKARRLGLPVWQAAEDGK
jgi:hypothetical protein